MFKGEILSYHKEYVSKKKVIIKNTTLHYLDWKTLLVCNRRRDARSSKSKVTAIQNY
jgi:hypothetical protein